jgi:outer membrane protein TolC
MLLAGALAAALLAAPLGAEQTLTLGEARSSALAHSRTLRSALLAVDSALLAEKLQSYEMLPALSASAGARASYPSTVRLDTLGASLGLSVTQTLYSGRQPLLATIDRIATQAAREEARAESFRVLEEVDGAFYGVLEAQAALEAAQSDLEASRTHLRLAEAKLEAGMITRWAFLQVESQAAAGETALIQSQGRLAVAEGKLASLTGLPQPLVLAAVDFAGEQEPMQRFGGLGGESIAALIQAVYRSATANNPTLGRYALASRKAGTEVQLASAGYLPSLSASYSYTFEVGTGQALDAGSGSVGLSASIPLEVWKTRASVRAADIAARQAELAAEDAGQAILLDIQSAVHECISSARSAASAGKALEYAEGYYQSVLELFKLSSTSSSELSDAQSLLSASRSALSTARYTFLANLSSLRTLAGLETESRLLALLE